MPQALKDSAVGEGAPADGAALVVPAGDATIDPT
jgi:hypothetical protein